MKKPFVELFSYLNSSLPNDQQYTFNMESNAVCELYNRLIPCCDVKYLRKIRIDLTPDERERNYISPLPPLDAHSTVVCIVKKYNFQNYFKLNDEERRKAILQVIIDSIAEAAEQFGWSMHPFYEAYQKVVEKNYINKVIVWNNKIVYNKSKSFKAGVQLEITSQSAIISIVIFDDKGIFIREFEVFRAKPQSIFFSRIIGSGKWINNEQFVLVDEHKEIHFVATLGKNDILIQLTPKVRSKTQLINDLRLISADLSKEETLKLIEEQINLLR